MKLSLTCCNFRARVMAAAAQLQALKEEGTCSICLDYFNDPVSVDCGHSFCRSCITGSMGGTGEATCPQCRRSIGRTSPRTNWQLRNIVEKMEEPGQEDVCEKPQQAEDQAPISSEEHQSHPVGPRGEAAERPQDVGSAQGSEPDVFGIQDSAEEIKQYKVMVSLDYCSAHSELLLSEGGRRVGWTFAQLLPEHPEQFTSNLCVLGSEGFTSGRHYWEVELLEERLGWTVGVAAESVERKEQFIWSPDGGVWAVGVGWDGPYKALTSPRTSLFPRESLQKLGVYLDYEGGRLSLYNADSMELLYTFRQAPFRERLFPFFSLDCVGTELRLV